MRVKQRGLCYCRYFVDLDARKARLGVRQLAAAFMREGIFALLRRQQAAALQGAFGAPQILAS
jgi:hypothetical protein